MRDVGLSDAEVARRLGVAPATVSYHLKRHGGAATEAPNAADAPDPPASGLKTRAAVQALLAAGIARAETARRLGISKATVTYHARQLGAEVDDRFGRRFAWEEVRRYYDAGHSVRQCMAVFGFSSSSWSEAVKRGAVVPRPSATPIAELLVANVYRGRNNLKARLVKEGLKQNRCERCGISDWRGEPLTLALHHINGERNDNRLENLELLCPNCHSQTSTYAGRNGTRHKPP